LKRIALLVTAGVVVGSMLVASGLSVGSAQEGTADEADVRAPWSKAWDLSEGHWYFAWYRWCYDPATSDPSVEENWYREGGAWEWAEQANSCPELGTCTVAPGSMRMVSDAPS
jgi:hypothetical protein